jgi:retron-type reverse transcriptase
LFTIHKGVKQSCKLSQLILNIRIDPNFKNIENRYSSRYFNSSRMEPEFTQACSDAINLKSNCKGKFQVQINVAPAFFNFIIIKFDLSKWEAMKFFQKRSKKHQLLN